MARLIADGVYEIDTKLGGWDHITAGYLLTGDAPCLIEVGSQSSTQAVLEEIESLGIGANDLASVAVTHIHLDHAGAVGDIAAAFPNADVYVHERGARHLADPERLISSAAMVYGELLDTLYGRMAPTEVARIKVVGDGDFVELSPNRRVEVINSPGHAKHHLGYFDPQSGLVFTGDAAGVLLPEVRMLRPATPPADFDLDAALTSLEKFRERSPQGLAFAHYGLFGSPAELLDEAEDALIAWAEVAERAYRNERDIVEELTSEFTVSLEGVGAEAMERFEVLIGVHSNAAGLKLWLDRGGSTEHAHEIAPHHHHRH
ncbi:MAG: MBL fold metallo-hydrolase [Actinomycetota bacterium]|nr:MBL fold metallo-hydrolase [Actinomycetota bacterium]